MEDSIKNNIDGLTLDHTQSQILHEVISLISPANNKFLKLLNIKPKKKSIYLFGAVGRGKTLIMKHCFNLIDKKKQLLHYQDFVQLVHQDIHQLSGKNKQQILKNIAYNYAKRVDYLFIDEFEIKDITDAMLIGPLLIEFIRNNIFIFLTSNVHPNDLYKNGLQRDLFIPFISLINKEFNILCLNSPTDYRLSQFPQNAERIFYPFNQENQNKITEIINRLTHNNFSPFSINLLGRDIIFPMTHANILVTSYNELFLKEYSYIDYIAICRKFDIIIIKDVEIIDSINSDVIVRFINFIDNAYFSRVTLYMNLAQKASEIYTGNSRASEFKRTISRLYEMNSLNYITRI